MKKIRKFLSQLAGYFGFTITINRILEDDFENLKNTFLKWKENNDLISYSNYLNKLTKKNHKRIKFLTGGGFNTTQTHCIVINHGEKYFEKIYDIKSEYTLDTIQNWNSVRKVLIKNNYKAPELIKTYKTDFFII